MAPGVVEVLCHGPGRLPGLDHVPDVDECRDNISEIHEDLDQSPDKGPDMDHALDIV